MIVFPGCPPHSLRLNKRSFILLPHKTFTTPIDREQIHSLINRRDDILDLPQDATETMSLYDVRAMNDDILRLGDISAK